MKSHRSWFEVLFKPGVVLALLLAAGCTTNPGMKGSPFYTGEFKNPPTSIVTNRLPAWPLVYYRDPALSICWPFFESISGESVALRPLFSVYDYATPTNREWNVLWPLIQQDNASREGRAVPFFWGEDYTVGFPLWWHFTGGKGVSDLMIPLWWYEQDALSEHLFTLLFGYSKSGNKSGWIAPLLLSGGSSGPDKSNTWVVWPLSHWGHDGKDTSSHVFPLWYWDSKQATFLSIPWSHWRSGGRDTYFCLPLLGGGASDAHGGGEFWGLAGLYNREWDNEGLTSDYLFPIYFHSPDEYLYTLLFGYKGKSDDRFSYYFTPLVGSSQHGPQNRAWAFPLWHRTANTNTQATSGHFLWGTWRSETNRASSQFFPFWGHEKSVTNERDYEHTGGLLWLYANTREKTPAAETASGRMLPFWYHSAKAAPTGERTERTGYLLGLYDSKREVTLDPNQPGGTNDYARQSLLGYAWRKETINGDVSMDMLPGIAYDRKKDGFTQTSFLLRMFRWQRDAEGKRKLDLLFIPILRD